MSELRLTVCDYCGAVSINGAIPMDSLELEKGRAIHACRICEDEPFRKDPHPKYVALETTLLALVKTT